MKKILLIFILCLLFPYNVFADEYCANETNEVYCTGSTCLSNLQRSYNTWNTTGNTGRACIKVIAVRNGNSKSYLSGKNPNTDYKCSNGNTPTIELKMSALSDSETNACQSETCYVPELWTVNCGDTNNTSNSGMNGSSNTSSSSSITSSNGTSSTAGNNKDNAQTNSNGQITGTTDNKDTGVETYFIVLLIMVGLSYGVLLLSKKNNKFKSI